MTDGLRIERRFTTEGSSPYDNIEWSNRDSRISNPDGSVVFEMTDAEIPANFSQVASDIMVSKYFRKAGVPQTDAEGNPITDGDGNVVTGPEQSSRQVFNRLLRFRLRCAGVRRRTEVHARQSDGRAEQPTVVQHRPGPRIRDHR